MNQVTPYEQWLASAPPQIQELAKRFPPGKYKLARILPKGPPYNYVVPGSSVNIDGYGLDGSVLITIRPEDKTPERLVYERGISEQNGTLDPEHYLPFSFNIEPHYLLTRRKR